MEQTPSPTGGWDVVAASDGTAALVGVIVRLDPAETYTRSALAEAADVPLKELYLSDALENLVEIGLLDPVEAGGEATYSIDEDSPVFEHAADFDAVVAEQLREN